MRPEEYAIYHLLNRTPGEFVPVYEIAKQMSSHRPFSEHLARTLERLKRLETEGLAESNQNGEFRLKDKPEDTTAFLNASESPGIDLRDTKPEDATTFLHAPESPGIDFDDTKPEDATTFLHALESPGIDLDDTKPEDSTAFLKALESPGIDLGDTAIITIRDVGRQP